MKSKKQFLQRMLVMLACLSGTLAVSAWTDYGIYVMGTQLTSDNAADVLGNGTVTFDADANKLTLNNAVINTGDLTAQGITLNQKDVTLEIIGTNVVTGMKYSALKVAADATITGSGKLIVSGADCGILLEPNNYSNVTLTIAGGVQVIATGAKGISQSSSKAINSYVVIRGLNTSVRATGSTYSIGNLQYLTLYNRLAIVSPTGAQFSSNYVRDANGNIIAGQEVVIMRPVVRGDVDCDGGVTISDVTALIDYLLSGNANNIYLNNADCDQDGNIAISDVTSLIDYLLSGSWPWISFTVNGVSFTMVPVEGGTFAMGATPEQVDDALANEYPVHQVTLSGYSIGQTEVTQELWLAVMGNNPSEYTGDLQRPVDKVSWSDCQTFITNLNQLTGKTFRLPTEAEWEFAARGGNKSRGYKYAGSNTPGDVAWYWGANTTQPVATKAPNELGLYDMSGNVWEWCQDWYGDYSSDSQTNPTGPVSGTFKVNRGGSKSSFIESCRVSTRSRWDENNSILGLRLAM